MQLRRIKELSDIVKWELRKEFINEVNIPSILDPWDSMLDLISSPGRSVSRFADGELRLMTEVDVPNSRYQSIDTNLSKRLKEVLRCDRPNCRVALPKWMIYWSRIQPAMADGFVIKQFSPDCKKGDYFKYFRQDYLYYDSCMSVPKGHFGCWGDDFLNEYYYLVKKFLSNRDILLVTGDERYRTMEHRLLADTAKSIGVVKTPSKNAWSEYDRIVDEVKEPIGTGTGL